MKKVLVSVTSPSFLGLAHVLRFCAAAVALHGLLLCLSSAVQTLYPGEFHGKASELIGVISFWILAVPALLLTFPFASLLWKYGLMNAPGWFAWPKPFGIALAYTVWVLIFLGLAQMVKRLCVKKVNLPNQVL